MIYCISDLHGRYDLYLRMIRRIGLRNEDTLYLLGDCVDRGDGGTDVLLDVAERKNAILLMGNHDYLAASLLQWLNEPVPSEAMRSALVSFFRNWFSDGGKPTYDAFRKLPAEKQKIVLDTVRGAPYSAAVRIGEKEFHLSHTLPEYEKWQKGVKNEDLIEGEPDYEIEYQKGRIFVTGHTPTSLIDPDSAGRIWKKNGHIAIDCGAVFGGSLGCICLDTMEEFYEKE